MPRNTKNKSSFIDFDNDTSIVNELSALRIAQNRLYKLDNPYVGSKRGILPDIATSFQKHDVKFDSMLDLFSGSSVVSIFFKLLGKQVVSNDLLTSSYYNALAFVENETQILTPDDIDFLCKNDNPNKTDWVRKQFIDRFTPDEAFFLDNYRANVNSLYEKTISSIKLPTNEILTESDGNAKYAPQMHQVMISKALAVVLIEHYIMNRCFLGGRLNHGQILAGVEHRIDHDRNGGHAMQFKLDPLPSFIDGAKGCKAYNGDALETASKVSKDFPNIELAYLDPPYGQAQSNYAHMYQFCEEFIYGEPLDKLPHIAKASEKFSKAKNYQAHFREVLDAVRFIPTWAVSFNASSFEDADGIVSILKDFKKDVTVVNIDHEYRYRKTRSKAVEYLFIAR